jgi:putative transposase
MTTFSLRKDLAFDWDGAAFRIAGLQPTGDLLLERAADLQLQIHSRADILAAYATCAISVPTLGEQSGRNPPSFSRPLDELPDSIKRGVERRWKYVKELVGVPHVQSTKAFLEPFINQVAAAIGDARPPSYQRLYQWYIRFRATKDTRALIPRLDLRGPKAQRQSKTILLLASEATAEAFKASPLANAPAIHTRLVAKLQAENKRDYTGEKPTAPSLRTTYRLLARLDAYQTAKFKKGKRLADNQFHIAVTGAKTTHILERVEIDHTPLDLFLVDELTWLPLGRPTLTIVLDHFSRMPLGYYLSFGNPSVSAVMGALRHALLPKKQAQEVLLNLTVHHQWLCYGIPDVAVLDNGLEFLGNDLESVAFDLNIRLQFCPKKEPWFKGCVERYLKTINYFFAHQLPGAAFSRYDLRGDYDPQKHAILTLAQFKHLFEKWVLDVYAQSWHEGIATTPSNKWSEGTSRREPSLPGDIRSLQRRIGHVTERSLRRDGINVNGIRYNGEAVSGILRTWGNGVRVRVVFDSDDLGEIQIWGPEMQKPVSVPAVNYGYASGLTLLQNQLIQTRAREHARTVVNVEQLQAAKHDIAMAVQGLMVSRKQRNRRTAAAIRGMSSNSPATDLLSDSGTGSPRRRKLSKRADHVCDAMPVPAYTKFKLSN